MLTTIAVIVLADQQRAKRRYLMRRYRQMGLAEVLDELSG
jgi:hypothetical protein